MDDFDRLIANLQRLRLDIERVTPADSTDEIIRRLGELQRRIDAVREAKNREIGGKG